MSKPKTYVETSVVSHLTAMPSRDLVVAAQQQVTIDWWTSRRAYSLFASDFVLDEAGRGDPMLNDNYIAPSTTVTSPHPERHC